MAVVGPPGSLTRSKLYYDPPKFKPEDEPGNEIRMLGTETNFTIFRNVNTGAAVELVDDRDLPGIAGMY
jgi:hypothetical protein